MEETLFAAGNRTAMIGWALLIFLPRWRGVAQRAATFAVPALISVAYSALLAAWWGRAEGGFGSLEAVQTLFQSRPVLLAGWLHYLAFDLFVGAWIAREARRDGIPHWVVVPILLLTLLFGPVGYLASLAIRGIGKVGRSRSEEASGGGGMAAQAWSGLVAREPTLVAAALVFFALMVPTAVALAIDDRTLGGVAVWLKPLKFEVSLGIYLGTLAWFFPATGPGFRRSFAGRYVVWAAIATSAYELGYIALQASKGVASHYNVSSPAASILWALMGVGAVALASTGLVLAWGVSRPDARPIASAYRLGIILGLVLTFLLGLIEGGVMASGTGHLVGTPPEGARSLPLVGWSGSVGDLRVAHFLGLHAQQAIAIMGALAATFLGPKGRLAVVAFATIYTLVNLALFAQALLGRPVWAY